MIKSRLEFPKQIWTHLIRPYWTSSERWSAYGLLAGCIVLMVAVIAVTVRMNYWNNEFFSALQSLNKDLFLELLVYFFGWVSLMIFVFMSQHYLLQTLEIRWRRWMTNHLLQAWMQDRRYYGLQLKGDGSDNPDQRISDDIHAFINSSLSLSLGLLGEIISLFSFLGILWSLSGTLELPIGSIVISIPGYMCWGAILYAVCGTFCTFYFGKGLTKLSYEHEKTEANFRYSLVRFRDNMEGVALYQGEEREQGIFQTRFQDIQQNVYATIKQMLVMNCWTSFYGQFQFIFPSLLAAPLFFAKKLTLGTFMQVSSAFGHVSQSLSFIVTHYVGLTAWRATTVRLLEFSKALEETPPSGLIYTLHDGDYIGIACDAVMLPHGGVLKEAVHFKVAAGKHTLISGPTGTGKSTLARAIAGLWPYGKGEIRIPSGSFLFLPQKPYLPLGSLREVLQYPASEASLEELCDGLDAVGLPDFKSRLGEINDWARILSLGEQQRIAILRALLTKPQWLVMDEATSAMDESSEAHLYRLLKQTLPEATLVSIGHRESLRALHAQEISLEGDESEFALPAQAVA